MSITRICIASAAMSLSLATVNLGVASADPPRVIVETPLFYPRADFRFDNDGYYRTHEGHYYHYDKDRDGWHYGRNHEEGVRFESRRNHGHR